MIFSGCFRRTKTHNPFKHDGFVILVRTPRHAMHAPTSGRRERAKEGGREGNRGIASARARGFLARSFVRSFDFVRRVRFRSSVASVRRRGPVRPCHPIGRKSRFDFDGGGPSRGFFAVRCGTDGWMDAVTDGRRATRRRRRATRARTMRKRRIPRGPAAATGDRGGDRRRAMARGVERRASNQPPVCVSWVVCVCHVCRVVTRRTLCLCV